MTLDKHTGKEETLMAKAKRLPSGNYHALAYSHTEEVELPDGSKKKVRKYASFTAPTKKEAEYMAAEFALKKKSAKAGNMIIGEAMVRYIESRDAILSPATIREYRRMRDKYLQGLMSVQIGQATSELVQTELNRESKTHSPKTMRNMFGLLSATFRMHRPDFRLDVTLPEKTRAKLYVPSDADIVKLLDSIKGTDLEVAVLLAAFGSLRRSEVCALQDADIQGDTVLVNKAMVMNDRREWVIKPPKTFTSDRAVKMPQFVIERISGIQGQIVPLNPDQVTKRFLRVLRTLDIPHFRFHDLRHYQASILHALGVPDKYIMRRGGWKSDTTLKNIYQHTMEQAERDFTDRANEHFSSMMQNEMQNDKRKSRL